MKRVLASLLMLAVYMGCGSVPDVMFVRDGDEGGTDSGGEIDSGADTGPICVAPAGTTCCGSVVCAGDCKQGGCDKDCARCGVEICCRKGSGGNHTVTCAATVAECPP